MHVLLMMTQGTLPPMCREYLSQRAVAAVAYLSTQGDDFTGGSFCFKEGPGPLSISPQAGRVICYTAGPENEHCVDTVLSGERLVLTMWFTREPQHCEDGRVSSRAPCMLAQQLSMSGNL